MTYDEMVKTVARAIADHGDDWQIYEFDAADALTALGLHPDGDNWLAPKKPSMEMIAAGWREIRRDPAKITKTREAWPDAAIGPGPALSDAYTAMRDTQR